MGVIERQAAIDALCEEYCNGHHDCKYYPKCENLKWIQKLPSAELATNLQPSNQDCISRQAAISELMEWVEKEKNKSWSPFKGLFHWTAIKAMLECLPSAQPQWNNHTVACMLAELFDDDCACNYNGIDEWLPSKCELLDACPNPVGVACWEQFLKHRAERRTDDEG